MILSILLVALFIVWLLAGFLGFSHGFYLKAHVVLFSLIALAIGFLKAFTLYRTQSYARSALNLYFAVTAVALNYVLTIAWFRGIDGFNRVLETGPLSALNVTLLTVIVCWLLIGSILILLDRRLINRENVLQIAGFYLVGFLYLNFLRERPLYGDVSFYIRAAFDLYHGEPLDPMYIYPPLWATLLMPLVPLGETTIETVCMLLNYLSLLVFYVLLCLGLERYGFSKRSGALLAILALIVNVPVLRNMGYVQVNIHVANLILLSLLTLRRHVIVSALALALAVHLKTSPIVLVLAFILARQWKWLGCFVLVTAAIAGLTILVGGVDVWQSYLNNVANILPTLGVSFRDNSIDSAVRGTFLVLGISLMHARIVVLVLKAALLFVSLWLVFASINRNVYYDSEKENRTLFNSVIVLLFLMTMLSPVVWTHHLVFVIFPFLVILGKLERPLDFMLYLAAYALIFLIPVFDFYPLSYKVLLGVILCYVLFFNLLKSGVARPQWLVNMERSLDRLAP